MALNTETTVDATRQQQSMDKAVSPRVEMSAQVITRELIGTALGVNDASISQQRSAIRALEGVESTDALFRATLEQATDIHRTVMAEVGRVLRGGAINREPFTPNTALNTEALFLAKTRYLCNEAMIDHQSEPAKTETKWLETSAEMVLIGGESREYDSETLIGQLNSFDSEVQTRTYSYDYLSECGGISSGICEVTVSSFTRQKNAAILLSQYVDDSAVAEALFDKAFGNVADEALGRVCCWALKDHRLKDAQLTKLFQIVNTSEQAVVVHDPYSIEGRAEYLLNAQLKLQLNKETSSS
jgi:hypothetical protein